MNRGNCGISGPLSADVIRNGWHDLLTLSTASIQGWHEYAELAVSISEDGMRFLGIGSRVYLGDIYLALQREGHEVRVFAQDPREQRAFGGLIAPVEDWRAELSWVGREGIIMFEGLDLGATQDELRAKGYRVVGGSAFGDRLENDREFGQAVMREAGMSVARSVAFSGPTDALKWLSDHPGRYALKWDDNERETYVGEHPEGADAAFQLRRVLEGRLLMMERLEGVEVGVGAYFDGQKFLRPACIDFEHKRFFPGDLGEMTSEMGTLASYEHSDRLFEATLNRLAPRLASAGHVGYLNLNLIVNEHGVWPLEFTAQFGNPGFAVLAALQPAGWGDLFSRMAGGGANRFVAEKGWSVCIVLTVPPFPGSIKSAVPDDDPPVFFHRPPDKEEIAHYHFVDMRAEGDQLFAHKRSGYVMIVTGTGSDVTSARDQAIARARNVMVPDLRWRADIGDRFLREDDSRLCALGWIGSRHATDE